MLSAIEHLMRLHPASHFGRWERGRADFESFEDLERRHVPRDPEYEYEADRRESRWMIGEVAVATAMLVAFIGVLTVMARWSADAPDARQQPMVAVSEAAEIR
jgi:hypothetical protein